MMVACIDAQILIWAIKKQATPDRQHKIKEATLLLQDLDKRKAKIIIPTVILSEFLANVPPEEHAKNIALFSTKKFHCMPYDVACAARAAKIWIA